MNWLIGAIGKLLDLLIGLLGGSSFWVMLVVSVFTSVWALLLFKAVTPQDRLTAGRERPYRTPRRSKPPSLNQSGLSIQSIR